MHVNIFMVSDEMINTDRLMGLTEKGAWLIPINITKLFGFLFRFLQNSLGSECLEDYNF